MRHHLYFWLVAGIALLTAMGFYWSRSSNTSANALAPEAIVAAALDLLEFDPKAYDTDTQRAIRTASVIVEQGYVRGAGAYHVLGMQYLREHNAVAAESLFKRAIATTPEWAVPYRALGDLLGRNMVGRREEAEEALRNAIALAPDWSLPYDSLAVLLRHSGRLDEAKEFALMALEIDPEDVATQNNYANLLFELGRYPEAEFHYLEATRVNPNHAKPYYNLACFYSLTGQSEKSLEFLAEAFLRAPVLRTEAARDPDLAPLHNDPTFMDLVHGPRHDGDD